MKTFMALSLSLLLLVSCMAPSAHATLKAGILSSSSIYALGNVEKAHTSAISCAGSSASSSSGGSASSSSSSNAAALNAAASACASAVVKAYNDYSFRCTRSDVTSFISVAATACARATLELRTKALVEAESKGKAAAYASACSTATGYSASCAKSIAESMSKLFADNGIACGAYTSATGNAKVQAAAKAIAEGLASSFAYAASSGKGSSKAGATALFTADVASYAKAIGTLFAHGCANCKNVCKYCSQLPDGDDASSKTLAISAKGRLALASAFSDAVSSVCKKGITVKAATDACLSAIGNVCVQIYASARGYASASGNAVSCTNSFVQGSGTAMSEAFGSLVAEATATAFKNDDCSSKAFATVSAEVFSKIKVETVVKAFQKACVASNGGSVSYSAVSEALDWTSDDSFSKAISDAISGVESVCECSGAGYCCSCEYRSPACPF